MTVNTLPQNTGYDVVIASVYGWQTCCTSGFATRNGQLLKALLTFQSVGRIVYINPYYFPKRPLTLLKNALLNVCTPPYLNPQTGIRRPAMDARLRVLNPLNAWAHKGTPAGFHPWLKSCAGRLLTAENPGIVWLYNAAEAGLDHEFPRMIKVFDTEDNWLEMARELITREACSWMSPDTMLAGYRRIAREGVWIISNGTPMTRFFLELGADQSRILELPNGVDPDLFDPAGAAALGPPADLASIPGPIAGYVGRFENRVDTGLLEYLVQQNPGISFVMIGAIEKIDYFEAPNLHWLGPRPYDQVPRYIYHFDAGILPHRRNRITLYNSPMKIYEYLSMGRPVVATSTSGIEDVGQFCHIAENRHEFNQMLRRAVVQDNRAVSDHVRSSCSWGDRAAKIMQWLGIVPEEQ